MGFYWNKNEKEPRYARIVWSVVIAMVVLVAGLAAGCPQYNVWMQELRGKAALREAEWNRQIVVQEAQAKEQAAVALAAAEVARAKGVDEANQIIADGLGGHEGYLRYLWIQALEANQQDVIYIPTEAGLPILEAGRLEAK